MLKADFSDIQKNGFRINQFRLIIADMRSKNYSSSKKEYKSSGDIIGERNLVIKNLIEQNEIDFTIYYFSVQIDVLLHCYNTVAIGFTSYSYCLTNNFSLAFNYLLYSSIRIKKILLWGTSASVCGEYLQR